MIKFNKLILLGSICLLSIPVLGAQVSPTPGYSVSHNGSTPASASVVLNDGTSVAGYRTDCTLENLGSHTLYYKFEVVGLCPSGISVGTCNGTVTTLDKQLPPGAAMNCNNGITLDSTALSIIGTSGDTYALSEQFVRGQ